jgi:glutaredoxin-related protein
MSTQQQSSFATVACLAVGTLAFMWWRTRHIKSEPTASSHATNADIAAIAQAANEAASSSSATEPKGLISDPAKLTSSDRQTLEYLTAQTPVVLCIKGDAHHQKCKFSRRLVELVPRLLGFPADTVASAQWLQEQQVACVDVLADSSLRAGLKTYANWPSFPMVWHRGVLVGGVDVVEEMLENGQKLAVH